MFVDVILFNVFLDLILYDQPDVLSRSFELFKRMHLIPKFVVSRSYGNPKHFTFSVFDFSVSNKVFFSPTRLLNFQ